jgi:hypothetical protein
MQVEMQIKSIWYLDVDDNKTLAGVGRARGTDTNIVKEIVYGPAGWVVAYDDDTMEIIPTHRALVIIAYEQKVSTLQ